MFCISILLKRSPPKQQLFLSLRIPWVDWSQLGIFLLYLVSVTGGCNHLEASLSWVMQESSLNKDEEPCWDEGLAGAVDQSILVLPHIALHIQGCQIKFNSNKFKFQINSKDFLMKICLMQYYFVCLKFKFTQASYFMYVYLLNLTTLGDKPVNL